MLSSIVDRRPRWPLALGPLFARVVATEEDDEERRFADFSAFSAAISLLRRRSTLVDELLLAPRCGRVSEPPGVVEPFVCAASPSQFGDSSDRVLVMRRAASSSDDDSCSGGSRDLVPGPVVQPSDREPALERPRSCKEIPKVEKKNKKKSSGQISFERAEI